MKPQSEMSGTEIVLKLLGIIWAPAVEAARMQVRMNVRSLEDTSVAAERAGCEVCYADLPGVVSGFAMPIGGKPHIVVNRAESTEHQQYTVLHELGHHILHLDPLRAPDQSVTEIESIAEFQAHVFAVAWIMRLTNDKKWADVLNKNPESSAIVLMAGSMTVGILLIALFAYLLSRFCPRPFWSIEEK